MSWLKDLVRPHIATRAKKDVAADVWTKCPGCGDMLYKPDLEKNFHVCTSCNHHLRVPLALRLGWLLDADSVNSVTVAAPVDDPLKFRDSKRYADRMKDARRKTGEKDAFQVLTAHIDGVEVAVFAMDFAFMGGSMGRHVGNAFVQAARLAVEKKIPLLAITSSGGARMQEGILSLMQMARTTAAIQDVRDAGLPYLVLLTDPTTGGVTASFATLGDVLLAEPGALVGFAGPRVIRETIGETLPEGFQKAEYLLKHGLIDKIVSRTDQPKEIANLLRLLTKSED